jgi:hypothetical protein
MEALIFRSFFNYFFGKDKNPNKCRALILPKSEKNRKLIMNIDVYVLDFLLTQVLYDFIIRSVNGIGKSEEKLNFIINNLVHIPTLNSRHMNSMVG